MKLYQANLSPFAARCRIAIYAKHLDVELADPPGGLKSAEYLAVNPLGKIPALLVDGTVIPESEVICEYFEDAFPEPSLRPADLLDRARARLISRSSDLYVVPLLQVLFGQVSPANRDAALVAKTLAELDLRLDQLESFVKPGPYAVGANLSLADCTIFPLFFFATRVLPLVGGKDPLASRPKLARWWEAVRKNPAVVKVDAELGKALAVWMGGAR